MPEYIAHASIDENGKIAGGKSGDQTGKEVCIRTWYNKNWDHVLRIESEDIRKKFAESMIELANNENVGYDQNQRNTLLAQAEKAEFDFSKIEEACECDCSSAVTVAILGAIYKVLGRTEYEQALPVMFAGNNCATTRTLRSRLTKLDMISVKEYTSKTYTSGTSYAVYGDIYLKEGSHVLAYIGNEKMEETESRKENSDESIVDYLNSIGKPSDFSSREVYARRYGIINYTGTAEQNVKLLKFMKTEQKNDTVYYKKYTGKSNSIVDALTSIGEDPSIDNRKKIAEKNGIINYTGTAEQNVKLLKFLKNGMLKK